jgi:FKBP-type peptidyl-prolyl cis-trans isomerase
MKAGGKRRVIVPPVVGYGAAGKNPVPPNSVLVFDVELLSVQ